MDIIALEDNNYIVIDKEDAKNKNLQIVFNSASHDSKEVLILQNGIEIQDIRPWDYRASPVIRVQLKNFNIDRSKNFSIENVCYLANKYKSTSLADIAQLIHDERTNNANKEAEAKLRSSKEEILNLSKRIDNLERLIIDEFRNTNSKIGRKR